MLFFSLDLLTQEYLPGFSLEPDEKGNPSLELGDFQLGGMTRKITVARNVINEFYDPSTNVILQGNLNRHLEITPIDDEHSGDNDTALIFVSLEKIDPGYQWISGVHKCDYEGLPYDNPGIGCNCGTVTVKHQRDSDASRLHPMCYRGPSDWRSLEYRHFPEEGCRACFMVKGTLIAGDSHAYDCIIQIKAHTLCKVTYMGKEYALYWDGQQIRFDEYGKSMEARFFK